jgi:hypothetical protein
MKATTELPDQLFRKAKAIAAERGQSLKQLVTEALRDKLALERGRAPANEPPWMRGVRVQSVIDQEFEIIESEDRR